MMVTLKSAVFISPSSLPPFPSVGGALVCESVGKADLLSDNINSKLSRDSVSLPSSCDSFPSLNTFSFGSSEVRRLLVNLIGPLWRYRPFGHVSSFLRGQLIFWLLVSAASSFG